MLELAGKVKKALLEVFSRGPLASQDGMVAQILVKLCDALQEQMLPYGVVLGWSFQTCCVLEKHAHLDGAGQLTSYAMPVLQEGQKRKDQLSQICQEGGDP